MTQQRVFDDPVLELAQRTDLAGVFDLAPTDDEARVLLETLDEVDSEQRAAGILAMWRRQGQTL